jgi:putative FmdB family regulatory protein
MAHYDYRCAACGSVWELNVPIAQRNQATCVPCPSCDEPCVDRVYGAPGVGHMPMGSLRKATPESFKDVLRNIKSQHQGSVIDV